MKPILFVVALLAAGCAYAHDPSPESPAGMSVVKSGDVVKLFYRAEKSGNVKVTIYNERGRKVFIETMRKTGNFMRPYNFSLLPEGNYIIEIADDQGVHSEAIKHSSRLQERNTFAHLARLGDAGAQYVLAIPHAGSGALTVKIFDDRNNLLYEGTEIVDGAFAKVYNLDKVSGNHTFEIVDGSGNILRLSKPLQK